MSEPKRVTFETISTGNSKNLASSATTKDDKTIRLQLKLFEPNADSFPQFNFKKLCRAEKEKKKITISNGFVDPLEEEIDHDAVKLAQEFERKYGNAYAGSDSRTTKGQAGADKNQGYDENNGFIDDSEAYDELVPDEMDTDRGGFYINSGHLQFRSKAPKRALSMSSDDESDSCSEMSATNENGNANKKQKLHEKSKIKKDNNKKPDLVVKNKEKPVPEQTVKPGVSNNSKEVKTTTVKDMLRAQRDALLKRSKSTSSATSDDSSSSDSSSSDSSSDGDQSRHSDEDEFNGVDNQNTANKPNSVENAVPAGSKTINKPQTTIQINGGITSTDNIPLEADLKLLDSLSSGVRDSIHRFVEISKNLKENLLDSHQSLEMLYEVIKANPRDSIQIYSYLEKVLPYSYQQFEKEVNDIAINKIQSEVRSLEREMQMEINNLMPGAEANHKIDLKRVEEQRAMYKGSEKPEHQFRNPRRKFPWNIKLKSDLPRLVAKWQSLYDQRQIPAQTMEQYTDAYITDKLLPMWPQGWMKLSEIQSHFMPKAKDKDGKKSSNEHKTSKLQHPTNIATPYVENVKDGAMVTAAAAAIAAATATSVPGTHMAEKRKSHSVKESTKMPKYNHDKTALKTDKKHHHNTVATTIIQVPAATTMTTASVTATSLLSIPLGDSFSSKPATAGKIDHSMIGSVGTSNNIKPKSINTNTNSNGSNAVNFIRPPENNTTLEYVSPTKKASDAYTIKQLISFSPANHSSLSSMTHQSQLVYNNSTASTAATVSVSPALATSSSTSLLLNAPSTHPVSSKNTPSSGSKSKSDSHHRSQSSSNGSNNNNFLHNNNNSKQNAPRLKDNQVIDLSCDTDDGEVVTKKPKHHKHKHNKKSKESGSSSSSMTNNSISTSAGANASLNIANNLSLPNPVQPMLNQLHHQTTSMGLTPSANDEVDHNKIIHDLKELSASNSSRKSYDSILENQSEFKQHYNHYRVSSPPYDRKQDHFF